MIAENFNTKPEIHIEIGRNIKRIRQHHCLSQKAFAQLLCVSFQQIQKYETGSNRMRLEHIIFIKNYFGLNYDHIFPSDTNNLQPRDNIKRDPVREKIFDKIMIDLHHIHDLPMLENMHKIISIFKY